MYRIDLRFYAELNDLLVPERRGRCISHSLKIPASVKDVIEAFGVPHTEIGLILANGEPVDFAYSLRDADRIAVYPVFRLLDIHALAHGGGILEGEPRFVLDGHLGRLAAYLRMLGFDVAYQNHLEDEALAQISAREHRVLLSRDRGLLKRSIVEWGYLVRETQPQRQLLEVLSRFHLSASIVPFIRCLHCNASLETVTKQSVAHRLPPRTREHYDDFRRCTECGRIYWKGPHYRRMQAMISRALQADHASDSLNHHVPA